MTVLRVIARVRQWIDGPHGTYGHAEILIPSSPTASAIFSVKALQSQPEPDEEFDCEIAFTQRRWRVVRILADDLPDAVEQMQGVIGDEYGHGAARYVEVITDEDAPTGDLPVIIPHRALMKAGIHAIAPGTPVTFDAERVDDDYLVRKLHSPTAREALEGRRSAHDVVEPPLCIAYCLRNWDGDSKKEVALAVRATGARVTALVWIESRTLRACGIRQLVRADPASHESSIASLHRIQAWSVVLQGDDDDAIDELEIDRLLVLLTSVRDGAEWRVERLIAPKQLRMPQTDAEVVDWVDGTILSVDEVVTPHGERLETSVGFCDPRLGRGSASIRVKPELAAAGGLAAGVPVTVRLVSRGIYWNVARIHRSTPLTKDDKESTLAE